jgi:hypothetical protein
MARVIPALEWMMPTHVLSLTGSVMPMSSSKNKGNMGIENPNPIMARVCAIKIAV